MDIQLTSGGKGCIALCAGLLFAPPAFSQDVGAEAIVVTGRGLEESAAAPAFGSQEIARERLTATASGRIEDALADAAGFQQFRRSDSRSSNPSAQGATLRALGGNATSRTLLLLDGVPLADPFFGYIPFSAIAPELLSSVRVTRGGGSGAFGAGAVAGTIAMTSAGPRDLGSAQGQLAVNDRGETELSAAIAPRLGGGFAVISGRWDRGAGFWTTPVAQRGPASTTARFDSWSAGVRAVAPVSDDVELQMRLQMFEDHRTLRFVGADSTSHGQDASVRLVGTGAWQFDALGYVQARDFSNVVISATSLRKTLDQRKTPSTGLGGKLELRPPLGEGRVLRLGIDARIADGGLQEDAYSAVTGLVTARRRAGGRNADLGAFAEYDHRLGGVVLTAGARLDRWTIRGGYFTEQAVSTTALTFPERSGWSASWRGGAVAQLGGGWSARASAYRGLRLPTLNELHRPFVVFPITTRANAALRPERLIGYEAGLDYAPTDRLLLSLTLFDNRVRDAIANVTLTPTLRERRNVAAVVARGVEANGTWRSGGFGLSAGLAWTHADLAGLRPAQTPKLSASATAGWTQGDRWRAALTYRHVGAQFEDDLNSDVLPAANTVDAYAKLRLIDTLSVVLRAENLFDEAVVTRNQAGSVDLGVPRTLWAGLSFALR